MRHGSRWLRRALGSILAGASLRMKREPKWKSRALVIEYWLATAVVAGSFVAGIVSAVRYLLR